MVPIGLFRHFEGKVLARFSPSRAIGSHRGPVPLAVEPLEARIAPAFAGTYSSSYPGDHTLTLSGSADVEIATFDFVLAGQTLSLQVTNSSPSPGTQTFDVTGVTTIAVNTGEGNDAITINLAGLTSSASISVNLGSGDDQLSFNDVPPVSKAYFKANGGAGSDTLAITADRKMTLRDDFATVGSVGIEVNNSFEVAHLTGGASDNTFSLQGWTGSASVNGVSGNDTLNISGNGTHTYTLSNGGFTPPDYAVLAPGIYRDAAGTITPSHIGNVTIFGGQDPTTFDVSRWSSSVTLNGGSGHDTLLDYSGASGLGLSDSELTRGRVGLVWLNGITNADLRVAGKAAGFDLSAWTGTASVTGGATVGGTIYLANVAGLLTLTDTSLTRPGHGEIKLANITAAILTGDAGDDRFDVSGWTHSSSIAGGGGTDTIIQSGDLYDAYDLTSTEFLRHGKNFLPDVIGISGIERMEITAPKAAGELYIGTLYVDGQYLTAFGGEVVYNGNGGNDYLQLGDQAGAHITFDGSGGKDEIRLGLYGSAQPRVTWLPSSTESNAGGLTIGGTTCTYQNVPADLLITAANVTVQPGAGPNDFTLDGVGISSSSPAHRAWLDGANVTIQSLVFDLGGSDSGPVPDSLTIKNLPGSRAGTLDIRLGEGDDTLTFAPGGSFTGFGRKIVEAGSGVDTLNIRTTSANVINLEGTSPGALISNLRVDFTDLENINLSGGNTTSIHGTGREAATWAPALSPGLASTVSVLGGAATSTIKLDGLLPFVGNLDSFTLSTPAGADNVTLRQSDAGGGEIMREVAPAVFYITEFLDVTHLTLDLSASDPTVADPADSFTLKTMAGVPHLAGVVVKTGPGDDTFTIDASVRDFGLPAQYEGIQFDPGAGQNRLIDQVLAAQTFYTAGGLEVDGTGFIIYHDGFQSFEFHSPLTIEGNGTEYADWTVKPDASDAGEVAVYEVTANGPRSDKLAEIQYSGTIAFRQLGTLALQTPDGADHFTLDGGAGVALLYGTVSGGAESHHAAFSRIRAMTLDLGSSDSGFDDTMELGFIAADQLQNLRIVTGAGDDTLRLLPALTSLQLPVAGGQIYFSGGAGSNTLEASADVSMALSDGQLVYQENDVAHGFRGALGFDRGRVQTAHFTGGPSDNLFQLDWPYHAMIDGLSGHDTFDLTRFTGSGTVSGGDGDDLFILQAGGGRTVSGAGAGVLVDGGAGRDAISAAGDVNFTLTDTSLARALPKLPGHALASVTNSLASIEAATLDGGASANVLDARHFSGTATLIGEGGIDTLIASEGGGALCGYTLSPQGGVDRTYTRDIYYLSDGTMDGAVDTIYATEHAGNIVSFRYYNAGPRGVHFLLPDVANGHVQRVSADGAPALEVALATGSLNRLEGSRWADQLVGNTLPNTISGLGGDDLLVAVGRDNLVGGAGHNQSAYLSPATYELLSTAFLCATATSAIEPIARAQASAIPWLMAAAPLGLEWLNPAAAIVAAGN